MYKLSFAFLLILFIFLSGCEKETSDIIAPGTLNPYEGTHIFTVQGNWGGEKEIQINNRGNFSFYILLTPSGGSETFGIIITGSVSEEGNLTGNVYKYQEEIGYLSGQLGYGTFYFNSSGFIVSGSYRVT